MLHRLSLPLYVCRCSSIDPISCVNCVLQCSMSLRMVQIYRRRQRVPPIVQAQQSTHLFRDQKAHRALHVPSFVSNYHVLDVGRRSAADDLNHRSLSLRSKGIVYLHTSANCPRNVGSPMFKLLRNSYDCPNKPKSFLTDLECNTLSDIGSSCTWF